MIIHFSILGVILMVSIFFNKNIRRYTTSCVIKNEPFITRSLPWILVFGYIAFLAAMRTNMNDTAYYINSFKLLPPTWDEFMYHVTNRGKEWGFGAVNVLFKIFISNDYHLWLGTYAVIETIALVHILRRNSVSLLDSCYFFFCSALYYNYFSMMRQWFAVVILFAASKLIVEKKTFQYILLCIIMAQFHNSAYLMIIVYFLVQGKAWSKKQIALIFSFVVLLIFLNPILNLMQNNLVGTTYDYAIIAMNSSSGSSAMRILIALVPVAIAFIYREEITGKMMNICVNMAMLNVLLTILAKFTSGLYIIRFSTYVSIYNVILYPYILNVLLKGRVRRITKLIFYFLYLLFYIYQMNHQGAFGYVSDILGAYY